MRKIIDGLKYDTEKADEIGWYENDYGRNDFKWWKATLYVTKKGNYFLHGEGGAMTRFSESAGNSSWGSEKLEPLTEAEAFEFSMNYLGVETTELYFKDMIEEA